MKAYRKILTADKRSSEVVSYKEFQGFKIFFKKPSKEKVYVGTFLLYDLATKKNRKQKVFYKITSIGQRNLSVEVI